MTYHNLNTKTLKLKKMLCQMIGIILVGFILYFNIVSTLGFLSLTFLLLLAFSLIKISKEVIIITINENKIKLVRFIKR